VRKTLAVRMKQMLNWLILIMVPFAEETGST